MPVAAGPAAIGAAVHSGWAVIVAMGNTATDPRVLLRSRIELIDEQHPESKQPYHAVESLALAEARRRLDAFEASARGKAQSALDAIDRTLLQQDYRMRSVGILDSSGRAADNLAAILSSHALIHTADGNHFRAAIAAAAELRGLQVTRLAAKALEPHVRTKLSLSADTIARMQTAFGKQLGAPWGADQKQAALLAWSLLEL